VVTRQRSLGTTPLWIVTLLGSCVTALGVYIQATGSSSLQQMIAGTLAALGGGVIGAAVSIYFSAGEGRDALLAVRELLATSLSAQMRSEEDELTAIRKQWHYYFLTERDGRFIWRYSDYHFEHSNAPGSIELMMKDNTYGRDHVYRAEVAVRGNRMILVETPGQGREEPIIGVTPSFTEGNRRVHAGVIFLNSWDGNNLLSKCLWSDTPLAAVSTAGDVEPEDAAILEENWDRIFRARTRILPSVNDTPRPMTPAAELNAG
jgi:hypothetical protein